MTLPPSRKPPLSRLMLGTVQFGMPYGVANRTGQPSYDDVVKMIAAAVDGGVNCFDTAAAYGESESVLGRAIHELGIVDQVTIVTKVSPINSSDVVNASEIRQSIKQSIDQSRSRLKLDCLDLVLFHRESDAAYFDILEELQHAGAIRAFGVSCDNQPGPSLNYVSDGRVSALQIPGNIIDRRHQQSGILEKAKQNQVAIFVRSVYLQGLLLMPDESIPAGLQEIRPTRHRLMELANQAGIGLGELCVRYLLSQPGVTSVIVGVETREQVRGNLEVFKRGPLSDELREQVDAVRTELPEEVVTPSRWPALRVGQ